MSVKIYERRQLVEAFEVMTHNGPKYMVREVQEIQADKPVIVANINGNTYSEIPKDDFETAFKEVPDLGGCC